MENNWNFNGVEHLERKGCSINIRERVSKGVISIEVVSEVGWVLNGSRKNRVIKR